MLQWIQRRLEARRIRQINPANARSRVDRGATYLDDVDPGWHRRVDADTLELSSGHACVLGQLHGDFRLGLGRAHLLNLSSAPQPSLSPIAYGFRCVQNVPAEHQDRDYRLLNTAWQAEVRARQQQDRPQTPVHAASASADAASRPEREQAPRAPSRCPSEPLLPA